RMFDTKTSTGAPPGPAADPGPGDGSASPGPTDKDLRIRANRPLEDALTRLQADLSAAHARLLELVAEVARDETWAEHDGCASAAHWLQWRCGLTPHASREAVRVACALQELPHIKEAFSGGELNYSQVQALTRVATQETEDELLYVARNCTGGQLARFLSAYRQALEAHETEVANEAHDRRYLCRGFGADGSYGISGRLCPEEGAIVDRALDRARAALREGAEHPGDVTDADALVAVSETSLAAGPKSRAGDERHLVTLHVDAADLIGAARGLCHLESGPAVATETARRITCDASFVTLLERDGEPLSVGRRSRLIPRRIRRALQARDRTCRFPGCNRAVFLDAHHIAHWTRDGGETALHNLVNLCWFHHRLVHEGGFTMDSRDDRFVFCRPDGSVIAEVPQRPTASGIPLEDANARRGLRIDHRTCVPDWDGTRLDPVYVVNVLLAGATGEQAATPARASPDP
ncbi:MAG: DUF222 domain-containing protein, partial [Actinomycetota bacterium]